MIGKWVLFHEADVDVHCVGEIIAAFKNEQYFLIKVQLNNDCPCAPLQLCHVEYLAEEATFFNTEKELKAFEEWSTPKGENFKLLKMPTKEEPK